MSPADDTGIVTAPAPGLRILKPRHRLVALMAASGRSNAQIAAELGMSSAGISTILKSPLMRALVAQYLREIEAKTSSSVADVLSTLRGETAKTLTTLVEIRDTGTREDSTRLAAAIELFDRQIPKVHKTDEAKTVRIVLDGARLDRLRAIAVEGVATPIAERAELAELVRPVREAARLDDVIARYDAASDDDDA